MTSTMGGLCPVVDKVRLWIMMIKFKFIHPLLTTEIKLVD